MSSVIGAGKGPLVAAGRRAASSSCLGGGPAQMGVAKTLARVRRFRWRSNDHDPLIVTFESVVYLAMTRLLLRSVTRL